MIAKAYDQTKERQGAIADAIAYPDARSGNCLGSLINFDFDPAILGSTFCGLVISDRFTFAKTLSRNSAAVDALANNITFYRIHTPFRQRLVVGFSTDIVGVTSEVCALVFVLGHKHYQPIENLRRCGLERAPVKIEQHVIQDDRPFSLRRRWGVAEEVVVAVEPALASVPAVAEEVAAVAEEVAAVAAPASENTLGHRKAKRQSLCR